MDEEHLPVKASYSSLWLSREIRTILPSEEGVLKIRVALVLFNFFFIFFADVRKPLLQD